MEYHFTLKYQLKNASADASELIERLGEAGCTDAALGIGLSGRLALEFDRKAKSADAALLSAIADVRRAVPSAKLIEVAPDLVGLTDVASLLDVSRQNMRKLMISHQECFPAPVHEGSTAIWHLADLLTWLQSNAGYQVKRGLLEVAQAALRVNLAKERRRATANPSRELLALLR